MTEQEQIDAFIARKGVTRAQTGESGLVTYVKMTETAAQTRQRNDDTYDLLLWALVITWLVNWS